MLDQPTLYRKGCFGRPESFFIYILEAHEFFAGKPYYEMRVSSANTVCGRCPEKLKDACGRLAQERVNSALELKNSLNEWLIVIDKLPMAWMWRKNPTARILWSRFLIAIRRHGGWTTVNDARLKMHAKLDHERKKKLRSDRRKQKNSLKRNPEKLALTDAKIAELYDEANKRLRILRDINSYKTPGLPRYISSLNEDGMRRTVDVWLHKTMLERKDVKPTGKAIIQSMSDAGLNQHSISTITWVYKDLDRIKKLEEGDMLWKRLIW